MTHHRHHRHRATSTTTRAGRGAGAGPGAARARARRARRRTVTVTVHSGDARSSSHRCREASLFSAVDANANVPPMRGRGERTIYRQLLAGCWRYAHTRHTGDTGDPRPGVHSRAAPPCLPATASARAPPPVGWGRAGECCYHDAGAHRALTAPRAFRRPLRASLAPRPRRNPRPSSLLLLSGLSGLAALSALARPCLFEPPPRLPPAPNPLHVDSRQLERLLLRLLARAHRRQLALHL